MIEAACKRTLHRMLGCVFAMLLALAPLAQADALDDAKSNGTVGEQANGYLGIVTPPGSEAIRALVLDINARRQSQYRSIAQRNDIALDAVELLGAQKALEKTPAGQFIRLADGSWRRK